MRLQKTAATAATIMVSNLEVISQSSTRTQKYTCAKYFVLCVCGVERHTFEYIHHEQNDWNVRVSYK